MWEIIENIYNPLSKTKSMITILEPRSEWSIAEEKKHFFASNIKWIISNSLCPSEYKGVSNCFTFKDMWDVVELAHVSTT